jgi:hypothetical protein
MKDWPSLSDEPSLAPKPGHVWITRRRWDAYFLAAAPVAVIIGVLTLRYSTRGGAMAMGGLAQFAMTWALIRWSWPRGGRSARTLSGTPGTIPLLWWLATWGLLLGLGGGALLHRFVPIPEEGGSWDIGSSIIWAGFAMGWFAGLLVGGSHIERRYRKPPPCDNRLLE